ncbi:M55 family metallopeptidase [Natrialba sp. SSL1]|uniref:M55 family metallopeptidase n=1 Tax=Natrialba sp. SSL1 TaxID=1869245 RepID=UPI0008F83D81|nr:M55 family metallopeptidase [Natrialba sp. SSL1]OIB58067.1 peptidase M55 [Natrialba sp. SSL1]
MDVFVSADMEGVTGVAAPTDVVQDGTAYSDAQSLFVDDVNAAIEGALEGGADSVLVNDAHATMTNLPRASLHDEATLIRGNTKPRSMMQGCSSEHDLALFVGYHAKAGTAGAVLNHTFMGHELVRLRVNGREVGELGWNARFAGSLDVPVGLVTGDDATASEARVELGDAVETVVVKEGIDRFSATCRSPDETRPDIHTAACRAVENADAMPVSHPDSPVTISADWSATNHAAGAGRTPGVERIDDRTTTVEAERYVDAYEATVAMLRAGANARDQHYG